MLIKTRRNVAQGNVRSGPGRIEEKDCKRTCGKHEEPEFDRLTNIKNPIAFQRKEQRCIQCIHCKAPRLPPVFSLDAIGQPIRLILKWHPPYKSKKAVRPVRLCENARSTGRPKNVCRLQFVARKCISATNHRKNREHWYDRIHNRLSAKNAW